MQEFLDPLDADFFRMDEFPDTEKPLDIIFGKESVFILARRRYQSVLFIETQCLVRNTQQFRNNADGVKGHVIFFCLIAIFRILPAFHACPDP